MMAFLPDEYGGRTIDFCPQHGSEDVLANPESTKELRKCSAKTLTGAYSAA
jgi:hypothetical protein